MRWFFILQGRRRMGDRDGTECSVSIEQNRTNKVDKVNMAKKEGQCGALMLYCRYDAAVKEFSSEK